MPRSAFRRLFGVALLCIAPTTIALESDRKQPIYIDADRVELDEAKGLNTYSGSVVVVQGTMQINADRLVIHTADRKPTRYVATGTPARYKQQPNPDEGDVVGTGNTIEYRVSEKKLYLRGDAHITRQGDVFQGDRLVYDTARDLVSGSGGQGGRIRMIIQPQDSEQ
ncbi:lipopolysaccharide transport periplasmic protein LptA [Immundisolibacter sp.]|jgi:lipopolysaccharide export system protein LptA|uniref:lipopolysaccharide transport periplasmic protein LptA n=1 Tax=Immundisolibacter sp. TaxID=1934948 RepID=UPI003561E319